MALSTKEAQTAEKVVREAIDAGQADIISKKMLVARITEKLSLEPGHFSKEQKLELTAIAKRILDEPDPAKPESSPPKPSKKATSKKRISDDSSSEEEKPQKARPVKQAKTETAKVAKSQAVKRKAMPAVPDSDEEVMLETEDKEASRSASVESDKPAKKAAPAKKRKSDTGKGKQYRTAEFINSEGDPIDAKPTNYSDSDDDVAQPQKKSKKSDEKPKAKAKTTEKKPRAPKKAAEPLDSDEEELKKLKSFVVACGERKIWSKEFAKHDLTTVKQQIKWLKQLLSDLGMPSRMSLGAAKEVGAKRALEKEARELGIDIGATEETEAPRAKRAAAQRKPPPPQQLQLSSDEDGNSDGTVKEDNGGHGQSSEEDSEDDQGSDSKPKKKGKKASAAYTEDSDEAVDEDGDGQSSSDFHDSD